MFKNPLAIIVSLALIFSIYTACSVNKPIIKTTEKKTYIELAILAGQDAEHSLIEITQKEGKEGGLLNIGLVTEATYYNATLTEVYFKVLLGMDTSKLPKAILIAPENPVKPNMLYTIMARFSFILHKGTNGWEIVDSNKLSPWVLIDQKPIENPDSGVTD